MDYFEPVRWLKAASLLCTISQPVSWGRSLHPLLLNAMYSMFAYHSWFFSECLTKAHAISTFRYNKNSFDFLGSEDLALDDHVNDLFQ